MEEQVCISVDCYEDVLIAEEFTQSETGAFQVKYYAPSAGNIKVEWRGEDATHEKLELTELVQLDPDALAEFREKDDISQLICRSVGNAFQPGR